MDIIFERGSSEAPKGHALLYFRSSSAPEEIWGTYLVLLPIKVDIAKYVPPFLMNQVGELGPKDFSAFAFPPAPEKVASYELIEEMAEVRDDDILFVGPLNPTDVASGMMAVNEAVQQYAEFYAKIVLQHASDGADDPEASGSFGVNEVMYSLMSDADRLRELTKLVGRLRFAVDGNDKNMMRETEEDIRMLVKHLPENHKAAELVKAAKCQGNQGAQLADLYLKRCYFLMEEEYVKVGEVEAEIRSMESGQDSR